MAGTLNFGIRAYLTNPEALPEVQERLLDLSPAFHAIVREWAELNQQKFGAGRGAEGSGAAIDDGVFWDPLTPGYIKQKHPQGAPKRARQISASRVEYPDWVMVRTGDLMRSMTNPDQLFQAISGSDAVFGTPLDPEDMAKVSYNWTRRQVVFLGTADKNMIRRIVQDYLSLGENFADIRKSQGFASLARRAEAKTMDAEFTNALNEGDGSWGDE